MARDTQSRKWLMTINNPADHGFPHEKIREAIGTLKSVVYWCMADEIGLETGTYHTHVFIVAKSGIRFSTLKKAIPPADLEMSKGTSRQNMEYVSKTGKWENDKKSDTRVEGTFEEFGDLPIERQGARNDLEDLYSMIKEGLSDYEILEQGSGYMLNLETISRTRQILVQEQYREKFRDLEVTYIWGDSRTGKTRSVMDGFGYSNVFRVSDYQHPFDNYAGQDVLLLDEFSSSLPLELMLKLLEGYPMELPCRYANKFACFTKVYVVSNSSLTSQYVNVYHSDYNKWLAFLHRFRFVKHHTGGKVLVHHIEYDHYQFRMVLDEEKPLPFEVKS